MRFPQIARGVLEAIGQTPVVQLKRLAPAGAADVFVKLEYFNPTGSYKDRMALAMIEGAKRAALYGPGCASSNTPAAVRARRWRWSAR